VKLGVLGGTFDPAHNGHLALGECARNDLGLDRVLFVPAGQPWRKADRDITPAEHRVAMLSMATEGLPAFEVSTMEVDRQGPSYTVETLSALRANHAQVEIYLILGEDALADLPNWRDPERILELATLAVARRGDGSDIGEGEQAAPGLADRLVWLKMPLVEVSASAIRERERAGVSIRDLVPEAVAEYIHEHGLYRQ
jgi:nicotinate-nucleotide adenylyltransferase